jgi:hypothetical protein
MAAKLKAEQREAKRRRVRANQLRGGTVAGQLQKMQVSKGYRRKAM